MEDLDFVISQLNDVLADASKYATKDNESKKSYVLLLKEKAIMVFDVQKRPHTELASYIWNKLDEIQFSVAKPWFEKCFTDNEKRTYSDKFSTEHFIDTGDNIGLSKNPISGQLKLNGVTYSPDLPSETKPKTLSKPEEELRPTKNKYTDLLNLCIESQSG